MKPYNLLTGLSEEVLKTFPENHFDSCVTDPPYGIGFMGKEWDTFKSDYTPDNWDYTSDPRIGKALIAGKYDRSKEANQKFQSWTQMWAEQVYRVLKPGAYLVVFASPRTYHRMVCGIEDAGFEIRDQIFWCFSSGFPKSYNIKDKFCSCGLHRTEEIPKHNLRSLSEIDLQATMEIEEKQDKGMQHKLPWQNESSEKSQTTNNVRRKKSSLEGRNNSLQEEGELQRGDLSKSPRLDKTNGEEGWIHNAASHDNGTDVRTDNGENGSGEPYRSQSEQQSSKEFGNVAGQCKSQKSGMGNICDRCGKPITSTDFSGYGTALKPAHEPILIARKPLCGTIIENLQKYRTGAINIDGCRIDGEPWLFGTQTDIKGGNFGTNRPSDGNIFNKNVIGGQNGRWPANLIHDGSDEVIALFPESKGQQGNVTGQEQSHTGDENTNCYGEYDRVPFEKRNDSGSAARFFYCAKTSRSDRNEGCENLTDKKGGMVSNTSGQHITRRDVDYNPEPVKNNHPTVKPTNLMRYLCRLVTAPGGHILDPFGGSGSTGKAAIYENFKVTLIDSDAQWLPIQQARCEFALRNRSTQMGLFEL